MIRRSSLAAAMALALSPMGAQALGLGEIDLKSALNQYLNADVSLLSVTPDELPDVRVKLADQAAFKRAGVERPFLLSKLRFQPMLADDGNAVIHITSRDPIREPFLNFLIEVNWPKGRLVREYTVLLDPPVTLARKPAPIQAPVTAPARQPAPAPVAKPAAPAAPMVSQPATSGYAGNEYGPTRRNDTLWAIAKQVRHSGTSLQQTMIALQQANLQAFINNNINNLKTGQILRVPSREETLALGSREAQQAYQEQVAEWQADRAPMASSQAAAKPAAQPAGTMAEAAPVEQKPELKIATPRPSGEGEAGVAEQSGDAQLVEKLRQDLLLAQEEKASAQREGDELKSRLDDLESQLSDLQRLLVLKNEQLAQLQALAAEKGVEATTETTPAEAAPGEQAAAETPAEASQEVAEQEQAASEAEKPAGEQAAQQQAASAEPAQPTSEPAQPVAEKPAESAQPEPVREEEPARPPRREAPSLLDSLGSDPTMLGVAVAGVVVLLALLWVVISRRRSSNADFQESILVSTLDDNDSEQIDENEDLVTQSPDETSFLSDFSPSDIDALQDETGEVDPLAEADVYIAYGRYQQAEELIRQAIAKDPERIELRYKLFEILFATKETDAFIAQAEEATLEGLDQRDKAAWAKVAAMGAQLVPGHALFGDAGDLPADELLSGVDSELQSAQEQGEEAFDLDNLGDLESELGLQDDGLEGQDEFESLSLDDLKGELDGLTDGDDEPEPGADGLDFDLDIDLGDEEEDEAAAGETDKEADQPEDDATVVTTAADLGLDMDEMDDLGDLGNLNLEEEAEGEPEAGEIELETGDDLDSLDLADLDLGDDDSGDEGLSLEGDSDQQLEISDTLADMPVEGLELGQDEAEEEILSLDTLEIDEADEGLSLDDLEEPDESLDDSTELSLDDTRDEVLNLDDLGDEPDDGLDDDLGLGEEVAGDEVQTKLDLASAYVDMGDAEGARAILDEVMSEGSEDQKQAAQKMLDQIS